MTMDIIHGLEAAHSIDSERHLKYVAV